MDERLTPELSVRVLRAKAAELETAVKDAVALYGGLRPIDEAKADIALLASLLADTIERNDHGSP